MATVRFAQLEIDLPRGWEARAFSREEDGGGEQTYSVLHVANFPMPAQVADYGGGAVEQMGPSHVFLALLEFGPESAQMPLFEQTGVPVLERGSFNPGVLHRGLAGQSATQHFFTVKGRPYCLYVVIGDHLMRVRAAPAVNALLRHIRFAD